MIAHGIKLCRSMLFCIVAIVCTSSGLYSCQGPGNVSCKEIFDKYYEDNVESFVKTMPDLSPEEARKKAECMLHLLYKIDSTFVLKRGKELDNFIRENYNAILECDSIN